MARNSQPASAGFIIPAADFNRRWGDWLICGALFLLPLVFFWPETLGLRAYFHHDLQYYFYPYHKVVADIVATGNLPLWNPYALGGMPLIGDGQTALFYPPNWLFYVLPAEHALSLVVLLHYGIAGVGTYAYVRHLGLVRSAAALAALAFMFNGFLVSRVVHYSILAGVALVPLLFLALDRLVQRPGRVRFAVAAGAVCLQGVAGHPQIPIYTAVGLGLYCLAIGAQRWRQRWRALTPLALLIGVYLVGYALAAVQLLPWIEWATFSVRAANASFEFVSYHSLHKFDWLLFLFPYSMGGLQDNVMQSRPVWNLPVYLWERLPYVGLVPLGLAVVGLAGRGRPTLEESEQAAAERKQDELVERDRSTASPAGPLTLAERQERWLALVVVMVGMLLIAAGSSTPAGYLVYLVPALGKLRAYARAAAVAVFAIAVLAGYGTHRLATSSARPRAVRSAVVGGLLVFGLVELTLLLANAVPIEQLVAWWPGLEVEQIWKIMFEHGLQLREANAYMPLLLATATGVLLVMAAFRPRALVAPLLLLTLVDMLLFARAFNPTIEATAFQRVPESVQFLRSDPEMFRAAMFLTDDRLPLEAAQSQLAVSWALAYGVEDVNGFNSLQTRRNLDLLLGPEDEDVSYGKLRNTDMLESGNPILNLFGVKYALVQRQFGEQLPDELTARNDPDTQPRWVRAYNDEHVTIYRNRDPLPRAYFAAGVRAENDPRTILDTVRAWEYDPRQTSIVEGISAERAASLAATPGSVELRRIGPNELRLTTTTDSEQLLVLSETWAPGWHAEVDGRPVPILRTNYLFRGLVVPAGTHEVRMLYRPASLLWGAAISCTALIALVAGILMQRRFFTQRRKGGARWAKD